MRGRSIDIWVVDEETRWRRRLCDALAGTPTVRCSHESRTAGDAFTALQHREAPDVLLFDPGATESATLELVAHLRTAAPGTAAVALSTASDERRVLEVIQSGAVGYLRKPIDEGQVVASIRIAHAGGAPLDPVIARGLVRRLHSAVVVNRIILTGRERAIVRKLVDGGSLKDIASSLGLSPHTVDTHIRNIYGKLGVHSRSAAVARAIREGLA